MISAGCIISGASVRRSVFFSDSKVAEHSSVYESVVLPEVEIGRDCRINRCIIDRGARIPDGTVIGENQEADKERGFRISNAGVTLVTPEMLGQEIHHTR
jgi:glucose-1-phosphate adenylyltransferase